MDNWYISPFYISNLGSLDIVICMLRDFNCLTGYEYTVCADIFHVCVPLSCVHANRRETTTTEFSNVRTETRPYNFALYTYTLVVLYIPLHQLPTLYKYIILMRSMQGFINHRKYIGFKISEFRTVGIRRYNWFKDSHPGGLRCRGVSDLTV